MHAQDRIIARRYQYRAGSFGLKTITRTGQFYLFESIDGQNGDVYLVECCHDCSLFCLLHRLRSKRHAKGARRIGISCGFDCDAASLYQCE
ncbi:hypothetical protein D9M69_677570 [compost metagenome]